MSTMDLIHATARRKNATGETSMAGGSGCSRRRRACAVARPRGPASSARNGGRSGRSRAPRRKPPAFLRHAPTRARTTSSPRCRCLGHRDVSTTMVYTHALQHGRSPLN